MSVGLFADPSQEEIHLLAANAVTAPAEVAACRMIRGARGKPCHLCQDRSDQAGARESCSIGLMEPAGCIVTGQRWGVLSSQRPLVSCVAVEALNGPEAGALQDGYATPVTMGDAREDVGSPQLFAGKVHHRLQRGSCVALSGRVTRQPIPCSIPRRRNWDEVDAADELVLQKNAKSAAFSRLAQLRHQFIKCAGDQFGIVSMGGQVGKVILEEFKETFRMTRLKRSELHIRQGRGQNGRRTAPPDAVIRKACIRSLS